MFRIESSPPVLLWPRYSFIPRPRTAHTHTPSSTLSPLPSHLADARAARVVERVALRVPAPPASAPAAPAMPVIRMRPRAPRPSPHASEAGSSTRSRRGIGAAAEPHASEAGPSARTRRGTRAPADASERRRVRAGTARVAETCPAAPPAEERAPRAKTVTKRAAALVAARAAEETEERAPRAQTVTKRAAALVAARAAEETTGAARADTRRTTRPTGRAAPYDRAPHSPRKTRARRRTAPQSPPAPVVVEYDAAAGKGVRRVPRHGRDYRERATSAHVCIALTTPHRYDPRGG
jgi:hypothetical protein